MRIEYNEDFQKCSQLQVQWNALEAEAVQVHAALEDVKQDFSAITSQQVDRFLIRVAQFYQKFKSEGPGRGSIDLAVGLKLMRETEAELIEVVQERDALVLAQKLFEMDITAYPELSQVCGNQLSHHTERRGDRVRWLFCRHEMIWGPSQEHLLYSNVLISLDGHSMINFDDDRLSYA